MKKINRWIRWAMVALIGMAAIHTSWGQNVTKPKIACPNGLWVNSYNGVLFFNRVDAEMQNTVLPIALQFYYNSSNKDRNYGYGLGFSMGTEMRYAVSGDTVRIERGDGRSDLYLKQDQGYQAPAGVFDRLSQIGEGVYQLRMKEGTVYHFEDTTHKKVTKISERKGLVTTLRYQSDGLLTALSDNAGRSISLSYTDGLLTRATGSFIQGEITYQYDGRQRLVKVTNPMGYAIFYGYDKLDQLTSVTDANGNKTQIGYTLQGAVYRVKTDVSEKVIRYEVANKRTVIVDYTEPAAQFSYYVWDDKGRAIEKSGLCCGVQSKLVYDEDDNVVQQTDANGNIYTYTYDANGNMLTATDPEGNTESYTYDLNFNQVTTFRDKNGNNYSFTYDNNGNVTTISGPEGFVNRFTYNTFGAPVTITDANGNVTQNEYNEQGLQITQTDAAGYRTHNTYDASGNLLTVTDAKNHTMTYSYDKNNQLVSQTDALGHTTTLSYDKVGNIVRVKDAKNQITAYTYDALGNVLSVTNPMGGTYTYSYDGKGNVLKVTDPMGNVTKQTWSEENRLLSQTNAAGETTSYDYDIKGNLITVLQPNGNQINYAYDQLDRMVQMSDKLGIIATYTYDKNGNQLTVTDGLNRTMSYTYDALNRKKSERLPSGSTTTYAYDNNSNLLSVTDALGHVTKYTYSSLDQQLSHTDALNAVTRFEYDGNGNMMKAIDAKGNVTIYTYDALNRNTVISFANGGSLQYSYDALGRVIASKDRAGREFKYVYNPLGDLLTKTYPDGTTDSYTYDALSRMLSAVNKEATVTFTYDKVGRLLSETLNGKTTGYGYDVAAGKRTLTYPSGMQVEEYLNVRDLITAIFQNGTEVVAMEYNVSGQKTKQRYANGITTDYGYNENGWLASIVADHDIMNLQMSYDAIGNMTERKDLLYADRSESYGYDVISQLTSFKRGTTVDKSYQFDLLGNRIKVLENGVATNYTSNNVNAYTNITGGMNFTPQYDANGNMLNDDKHTYIYDYNNKLVGVDKNVGIYKYDALGRRIAKNNTLFYYVSDQMVEEVTNGATTSYLYGNNIDEALLMKKGNETFYYHTNHLGSTMAMSDAGSRLKERVEYDVYGLPVFYDIEGKTMDQSSIGNAILFTGREFDTETGNYYFRARTQHPAIGRFMQKDPLMYVDGMNDYTYVMNNIIMQIDPEGLISLLKITMNGYKASKKVISKTKSTNKQNIIKAPENMGQKKVELSEEDTRSIREGMARESFASDEEMKKLQKEEYNHKLNILGANGVLTAYWFMGDDMIEGLENMLNRIEKGWTNFENLYESYDNEGKRIYRDSANWWFRQFHGGEDYNGCNGLFDPNGIADVLWFLTAPI